MRVIDSAESTAEAAAGLFSNHDLGTPFQNRLQAGSRVESTKSTRQASAPLIRCFATDSVEKFQRLGSRFLDRPVGEVELVDLGG